MPEPPQIPTDMKAFNKALIEEFRGNHGQLSGGMAGRQLVLLTTTGAQSGEPRTTVVGYRQHDDQLVVIASGNGAPNHPAWYRNLQRHPIATVELGPEKFEVRARTATPEERGEYAKLVPYLEGQQKLTEREIPVVILERTGPG
ncbi:MAG TPA: nitroreductase/quinone reductase family protein [Candidatus Dormibacteraeota bacterium]|jgi:deazaflavin-dependent oxidoreductase (nitroreductase family)